MLRGGSVSIYFVIALLGAVSGMRVRRAESPRLVASLFSNATAARIGLPELDKAFSMAYNYFNRTFDYTVSFESCEAQQCEATLAPCVCKRCRFTRDLSKRSAQGSIITAIPMPTRHTRSILTGAPSCALGSSSVCMKKDAGRPHCDKGDVPAVKASHVSGLAAFPVWIRCDSARAAFAASSARRAEA